MALAVLREFSVFFTLAQIHFMVNKGAYATAVQVSIANGHIKPTRFAGQIGVNACPSPV